MPAETNRAVPVETNRDASPHLPFAKPFTVPFTALRGQAGLSARPATRATSAMTVPRIAVSVSAYIPFP